MVYTYATDKVEFIDWADCPTYIKTKLSDIVKDGTILKSGAVVNCMVDIDINYEDSIKLKEQLCTQYNLREINLQENPERLMALEGTEIDENLDELDSTSEMVLAMLKSIEAPSINNDTLIKMYKAL